MRTPLTVVVVSLLSSAPYAAPLSAQVIFKVDPNPAGVSARVEGPKTFRVMALTDSAQKNRGTLGIMLTTTESKRDTLGVFVSSVVAEGPGERAGIVEGDRIVSINGTDLRISLADTEDPYTAELPIHRARREVRKLAPGSVARLRVYSGGRYRDVSVTVGKMSDLSKKGTRISISTDDDAMAPLGDVIPQIERTLRVAVPED